MLKQRIITAAVLLAVVAGSLALSTRLFMILMAAAFALVLYEWLLLAREPRKSAALIAGLAFAAAAGVTLAGVGVEGAGLTALELLAACAWCALLAVIAEARCRGFRISRPASLILAMIFVPAAWLAMLCFMRRGGWPMVLSVFAIVWLADVCAYFCGRAFGKRKMAPAISPGKTWAGAAGAVACTVAAMFAAWLWLPRDMVFTSVIVEQSGFVPAVVDTVVLVALSIAGDLFESALKRQAGVKDSGSCLPGHGGFYDRLDAALAVFPAACALMIVYQ
ncbi:MAG: phosphatidate cytidylyltransferase [Duodenibacillus sp.]|nr:phosphatidate cytidylyltransferase [Duodenibacillus sp.]